ncbi:MAG: hypothetical protein KBS82_05255 [Oscillospiraceae bacterium]|nr:hypothetical protein [Candidatus Limimonas egerieequi]
MGFRTGNYCTVWAVETISDSNTKLRISTSRKNKDGEYETDFSGFVSCLGTSIAKKAAGLKEKDRIKLGDVDVSTKYDKEKNVTYTNYKVFSFEMANFEEDKPEPDEKPAKKSKKTKAVDDGEVEEPDLPF